jgi:ParB family transcriptional regulator, chromosome partitioning protein
MTITHFSPNATENGGAVRPATTLIKLPLEEIDADAQVRVNFDPDAMASLTESLKTSGQIVPILAYHDRDRGKYIIVDGERRFRAAKAAEFPLLEALVFSIKPTPAEIALVQLTIDAQREDLDAIDQAQAYARVMETCGLTATDLAAQLSVSHTTITRAVSLLALAEELKAELRSDTLSAGIARELVRLPDEVTQRSVWEKVKVEGLNAQQTQKLVTKLLKPKKKVGRPKAKTTFTYKHLAGFEAVVTPKKITLVPSTMGKPRSREQMLAALEMLAEKLREDIARSTVEGQNGAAVTAGHTAQTTH